MSPARVDLRSPTPYEFALLPLDYFISLNKPPPGVNVHANEILPSFTILRAFQSFTAPHTSTENFHYYTLPGAGLPPRNYRVPVNKLSYARYGAPPRSARISLSSMVRRDEVSILHFTSSSLRGQFSIGRQRVRGFSKLSDTSKECLP